MIDVESKVKVYEDDGKDVPIGTDLALVVKSHWNHDSFVVLEIGGKRYTVTGGDLIAAIRNATNTARRG